MGTITFFPSLRVKIIKKYLAGFHKSKIVYEGFKQIIG